MSTQNVNIHHCLGAYHSVFLKDSHHPPTEILVDACRKILLHLTAAQPTNTQDKLQVNIVQ